MGLRPITILIGVLASVALSLAACNGEDRTPAGGTTPATGTTQQRTE